MGSITRYAAINSKLKAMERRFLTKEQYKKIIKSANYEETISYIKDETLYGKIINSYNLEKVDEENIQYILTKDYIKNFHSISSFFNGEYKKLFNIIFMKFQFEDLILILRGKYTGRKYTDENSLITYDSPLNKMNFEKIISSKDINEAISMLKDNRCYKYLHGGLDPLDEEFLFRLEVSLDYIYYVELMKALDNVDKEDKAIINKIIGSYIDLLNIQFIYRAKKYYKLSSEEILNHTIPNGFNININKLKRLCYHKNLEELQDILSDTKYKDLFKYGVEEDYLTEKYISSYIKKMLLKYKKEHKNNIGTVIAYLELSLFEIKDIISLLEAKRYCIKDEELLSYISFTID
ncbi:V-type ATPase subunit [uncultured Clostridium sp.]|uniref:V-type ATPase subunit n=1 Tax=uncultured Clostridium sp. TaxID=59620 RepID=UPI0028EB74A7|nr:V-type ATPase subunit [uncultured Clostridium sp.]